MLDEVLHYLRAFLIVYFPKNRKEKSIKGIILGQEEVQLSLLTEDIILYIGNSRNSQKKLLKPINSAKLHTTRSTVFLYTNSGQPKKVY